MQPNVYKFGGTSVGSADAIRLALTRIREAAPNVVSVVSAANGITDLLLSAARDAQRGKVAEARAAGEAFAARHRELVELLIATPHVVDELEREIDASTRKLMSTFDSVADLVELSQRTLDAIGARGERIRFSTNQPRRAPPQRRPPKPPTTPRAPSCRAWPTSYAHH